MRKKTSKATGHRYLDHLNLLTKVTRKHSDSVADIVKLNHRLPTVRELKVLDTGHAKS